MESTATAIASQSRSRGPIPLHSADRPTSTISSNLSTPAKTQLTRSPGGFFPSNLADSLLRSDSAQSGFLSSAGPNSPSGRIHSARRRSTETSGSGGLDYYWSTAAGVGPSSSSSSLAISPSPSTGLTGAGLGEGLSQSASASASGERRGMYRKSESSLRDLIAQEQREELVWDDSSARIRAALGANNGGHAHGSGRMSRGSSGGVGVGLGDGELELESPGWSGESDYSSPQSFSRDGLPLRSPAESSSSTSNYATSPVEVWNSAGLSGTGRNWQVKGEGDGDFSRNSTVSSATATAKNSQHSGGARSFTSSPSDKESATRHNQTERTPVAWTGGDRPDIRPPELTYASDSLHATPIVSQSGFARSQPSPSSYTPGSGRLGSGGTTHRGKFSNPSSPATTPPIPSGNANAQVEAQSAPPWQGDFGRAAQVVQGLGQGEDETVRDKGKEKRSTLPAGSGQDHKSEYLSPEKGQKGGQGQGVHGSPQPPPRSSLRTQLAGITSPLPNLSFDYHPAPSSHTTHSPIHASPPLNRASHNSTPVSSIALSRDDSSDRLQQPASQHLNIDPRLGETRSRARGESTESADTIESVTSINDLTNLLGGAIDEIGLIDSRETPPPMIAADKRDKHKPSNLTLGSLPDRGVDGVGDGTAKGQGPITPGSLPSRGDSLDTATVPPPVTAATPASITSANPLDQAERPRQTSGSTLQGRYESHAAVQPVTGFKNRPWPAAMLFGHVKNMKNSGDRAKFYAKGINDLALADTGLKDWCIMSASTAHRVQPVRVPLSRFQSNLSTLTTARSDYAPSISIQSAYTPHQPSAHPRNVSSSSEFPMREDSYTAREISQRVIDPSDQPTGLPANLPYPQLQQVKGGGMRPSPSIASMASMASMASTSTATGGASGGGGKRGFFKGLRGKKDSGGLGPPTGQVPISGGGSGAGKRDVRGLQISEPERTSFSSSSGPTPMGPRGPRMGGAHPSMSDTASFVSDSTARGSLDYPYDQPYRSSLDTGLSRLTPPSTASLGDGFASSRASFDSSHTQPQPPGHLLRTGVKGSMPPLGQRAPHALAQSQSQSSGQRTPKEEDVRSMQDVLPHVDKAVVRAYLARHGDQMTAISAYFEDEKRGNVRA